MKFGIRGGGRGQVNLFEGNPWSVRSNRRRKTRYGIDCINEGGVERDIALKWLEERENSSWRRFGSLSAKQERSNETWNMRRRWMMNLSGALAVLTESKKE